MRAERIYGSTGTGARPVVEERGRALQAERGRRLPALWERAGQAEAPDARAEKLRGEGTQAA